jgi:amidase
VAAASVLQPRESVGVQAIGRLYDEATLLRLGAQLEVARPWAARRPGVSA